LFSAFTASRESRNVHSFYIDRLEIVSSSAIPERLSKFAQDLGGDLSFESVQLFMTGGPPVSDGMAAYA
jgi:hypothetical protein